MKRDIRVIKHNDVLRASVPLKDVLTEKAGCASFIESLRAEVALRKASKTSVLQAKRDFENLFINAGGKA